MTIWAVTAILIGTIYLLVSERIPVALTAVGVMVSLAVTGLLPPKEVVSGFSHPAVITVGAMFAISKGMMRTGAVEFIGRQVIKLARGNVSLALALILFTVGIASAFINNTPVVILFIPVVMTMCCEYGLSPSKFLIPMSYASILAGTATLIGTSTNIIVSDLSAAQGFGALNMFELSILGAPLAVLGILFLLFVSPRLMPSLINPTCQIQDSEHRRYLAEFRIPRGSSLVGQDPGQALANEYPGIEVLELIRHSHIFHPERDAVTLTPDDLLLVKGSLNDLVSLLAGEDVKLPRSEKGLSFGAGKDEPIVVELLVSPHSALRGQRLLETDLMRDGNIHVMAIKRSNLHFTERQIHDVRLKTGDMLLVWCYQDKLNTMRSTTDYIIIEDVYEEIVHKKKAWLAAGIFVAMVGVATSGALDIMTCALAAAFLLILTGCLQLRDTYKALQGDVLLLIVGTISLGAAMQKTGASQFYAETFLSLFSGFSPRVVLGGVILMTSLGTQMLSNNATAVLVFPVAVSTALSLGLDPKPFIIGVCFGASACFASPIGYQTNLLVYGPGGYRFSDYLKLGIPLNLLVLLASTVLIPFFWPF